VASGFRPRGDDARIYVPLFLPLDTVYLRVESVRKETGRGKVNNNEFGTIQLFNQTADGPGDQKLGSPGGHSARPLIVSTLLVIYVVYFFTSL
jgi:hypothetical protein